MIRKHQMMHEVQVTPEEYDSYASPVQESLGWSFDDLVNRALRDPQMNQQIKARGTRQSKIIAMQGLQDGVTYEHPMYMTDRQQYNFTQDFEKNMNYYQALNEAIAEEELANSKQKAKDAMKAEVLKELQNEGLTPQTGNAVSTGTISVK